MADPFDTLGVEPRFDLDLPALEQRHRDLSRALHPDRYTGAPAAERRLALGRAIDANEAFRALKDPVRRAEALLARAGVPVGETREPKPPAELLMEMMEVREELSDAARAKDLARVAALATTMRARREAVLVKLGALLAPIASSAHADLHAALPALGELRYIRRFLDEVGAIEDDLAP
jgi:molecular chaperone HscB